MSEVANWTNVAPLPGMSIDELQTLNKGGNLIVLFRTVQKKNEFESKRQNRPVFVEKIHITKIVPGDKGLVIDRPIRETDKEEFPVHWANWERTRSNTIPGIPIENWHAISDTQKAEFRAMNIRTIEQFANLPDSAGNNIMGFLELRKKAKVFVEAGKDAELVARIKAESEEKVTALEAKLAELTAMVENLTSPKKAG